MKQFHEILLRLTTFLLLFVFCLSHNYSTFGSIFGYFLNNNKISNNKYPVKNKVIVNDSSFRSKDVSTKISDNNSVNSKTMNTINHAYPAQHVNTSRIHERSNNNNKLAIVDKNRTITIIVNQFNNIDIKILFNGSQYWLDYRLLSS